MIITDELREYAREYQTTINYKLLEIANRIDDAHEKELSEQYASLTIDMEPMTEENMAKGGWVKGPLDADGEMWHSGDMSDSTWGVIEGIAYENGTWFVCGHDISAPWIPADSIRHYHEPTVEDVLKEFVERLDEIGSEDDCCGVDERECRAVVRRDIAAAYAEYAEKLREAIKHEHH